MPDPEPEEPGLPGQMAEIAETIGLENTLKLMDRFGGELLYICKADRVRSYFRDRKIREDFTGANQRELARRYGVSMALVYKVLRGGR
jgi:Mor family transcriptional regulator